MTEMQKGAIGVNLGRNVWQNPQKGYDESALCGHS